MADTPGTMHPCLFYRDAPAAIEWLSRAFGFELLMNVRGDDDSVAHCEMKLGTGVIMLGTAGSGGMVGSKPPRELGAFSQSVYVVVDDVKAHHARAQAAGAEMTRSYEEKDYGGAGYSARDPEGHEWSFGSYAPDLAGGSTS